MHKSSIYVVDDERDMREFFEIMLRKDGHLVRSFQSASDALEACASDEPDLVITDLRMPGMDGVEFLKRLRASNAQSPVIMVTAYASVDTAIEAMKSGAYDYFTKPFRVDEVRLTIAKALKVRGLELENKLLRDELRSVSKSGGMVGSSARMTAVFSLISSVAKTRTNVFITGESGTGKELAARAIHVESERANKPFMAVNCGAIPENLIESELFGHQKGSFTGAVSNKTGLVEMADGGTFFLDEVTELPLVLQVKLLRFIQDRSIRRVGAVAETRVDVRIVAASNRDVDAEVKAGRFREDLYYRLNVIRINMPPLRERAGDIPLLAVHFIEKYSALTGKPIKGISPAAMRLLDAYGFPGNVRELENVIERAVALEPSDVITPESLPEQVASRARAGAQDGDAEPGQPLLSESGSIDLERNVEEYEKKMIFEALKRCNGVKKRAAEMLGLTFRSMRYKLAKYGISDND